MKTKMLLLFTGIICFILFTAESCDDQQNSNRELGQKQEQLMQEANRQVGMPAIKNFQERKLMKMIFELRDQENLVCYCYLANEMNGTVGQFIGKCIGYGLPYATQYTNPEVDIYSTTASSIHHNLPQADPNGLFMPSSAEGTWVMLIDPATNEPHPVYIEPRVIISPFKLK